MKEGWTNRDTGKKGEPRLQYNSFQLLHDVMETQGKKLTLTIPLNELAEGKINSLKQLVKTHKGEKQLFFVVYENDEKINLTMPSRKHKINISKELLDALDREQFHYKLN